MGLENRTSTGLRETETVGGHKQNLVHTRTQGKGAATPQEMEQDLPVSVLRVSGRGVGQQCFAVVIGAVAAAVLKGAEGSEIVLEAASSLTNSLTGLPLWLSW